MPRAYFIHFLPCFAILFHHFNTLLYHFLHLLLYFLQHLPTQPNRYKLPKFLPSLPKIIPNRYNRYNPYFIIGPPLSTQNNDLQQFPQSKNIDLRQFPPTKNIHLQHPEATGGSVARVKCPRREWCRLACLTAIQSGQPESSPFFTLAKY